MSQDRLVSVLLPVYNAERYLGRCIDSVLGQTYRNWELVAIDDGSQDASASILDQYAHDNPGLLVVEHRENGGVASARNRAIELAHGHYLAFIDNDDYFDPDYLETFVHVAQSTGAQVVCGGFRRPDDKGSEVARIVPKPGTEWAPYAVEAAWAKLYDADFVRSNALSFLDTNIGEDLYFTLPAIELATRVEVIDYCGYNWFFNAQSVSSTNHRHSTGLDFEASLDAMAALVRERGIAASPLLVHYFAKYVAWFLLYTCRGDSRKLASDNMLRYASWLDANLPGWRDEPLASPSRPRGESLRNRLVVWLFVRHPSIFGRALAIYRMAGEHVDG